ncbi:MAG: amidohydrolase family protein, partial [Methyloceanibacter sp.]|uniref:amidohydrolase family protein n=1 Tax=Methyloceanibacter sp. TaxID=1965321 RepID=UPI003C4855E8
MKTWIALCLVAFVSLTLFSVPLAAEEESKPQVLLTNVNIFDGTSETLAEGMNVLVEGNLIKKIAKGDIEVDTDAIVIDGGGDTLMPGLIDMHQHLMLGGPDGLFSSGESIDFATVGAIAAQNMYAHLLMKGVTTVRDIAGNSLGLAKAVRLGWITGPRIYSSGPPMSPLGG